MGTFDDNRRRTHADADALPHGSTSTSTRPPATSACAREVERFPFVPDDPARLEQDCYEAYNIQVSGLEQRLRADRHDRRSSSASPAASTPPTR